MATAKSKTLASVVSNSSHAVELASGLVLTPGASEPDVDMDNVHNRALYFDGHIGIVDGFKPRTRHLDPDTLDSRTEDTL
jgi:hypothetical protein